MLNDMRGLKIRLGNQSILILSTLMEIALVIAEYFLNRILARIGSIH